MFFPKSTKEMRKWQLRERRIKVRNKLAIFMNLKMLKKFSKLLIKSILLPVCHKKREA